MKHLRMIDWWLYAAVLLALVAVVSPANLAVVGYKLSLVALGGALGYLLDRSLFPYARPHAASEGAVGLVMIRRAIIVAAAMVGMTMGL